MKENQKNIFFLAGENLEQLKLSPLVERLVSRGYEVLFMTDAIDEYAVGQVSVYYKVNSIILVGKIRRKIQDDQRCQRRSRTQPRRRQGKIGRIKEGI